MMVQTLYDKRAAWCSGQGPEADVVPFTRGTLSRNLADFPFPWRCSEDERHTVEERVLAALEHAGLLATGLYVSLAHVDGREPRFLAERGLLPEHLLRGEGPRGVYISEDQALSIVVNGLNHLTIQYNATGLQPQEVWVRLNRVDDTLGERLGYAFDDRLGFLTAELATTGTGFQETVVLHLPALTASGRARAQTQGLREQWHRFEGLYGGNGEALGDLYALSNQSTLGRSEEETAFHIKHLAQELIALERAARMTIVEENPRTLEDRVGRALGVARGARLLDLDEAMGLLSSLRLGVALGQLPDLSLQHLNDLMLLVQNAHLEMRKGHQCDDLTLSAERADLLRARLAG